jgi:gamma-glutamylputrescine oxidase
MLTAEPKAQGSSWYNATRVESPARSRLTVELDVDVCVIGAGLAGLTVAVEVARRGWSVIVLETQSVAWDASGRNTGIVRPGFTLGAQALVERVGIDQARKLWALSVAGAQYVRKAARKMTGAALSETGWLHVSKTDNTRALAAEAALMVGEFGTVIEPWPADRVREVLRTGRYFHGLHYPDGFSLHPLNYALGLAAAAEAAGARIFEDTPVTEIDPAGVRKRIVTGGSRVRAGHVVLAGNVHLAGLLPQFSGTLQTVHGTVLATAPLGEALDEAIRYPGAVSDGGPADNHYRVLEGGRLMWSGRNSGWRGKPQRTATSMLREMRRIYPGLRGAKADYAWTGALGATVHGMPQIGEISPGLWLLSGFGNHGINTTAMGGEVVAKAILDGDPTWQLFSQFPLVWAGGKFGRVAKQVLAWSSRANTLAGNIVSRQRETKRLQTQAQEAKVKQFSRIAAAAVAPTAAPAPGLIHRSIEEVGRPIEAETRPPAPTLMEKFDELFPVEPATAKKAEQPVRVPDPHSSDRPEELFPNGPLRSEAPPRQPSAQRTRTPAEPRTTLGELSRGMMEGEPASDVDDGSPMGEAVSLDPAPADKKV